MSSARNHARRSHGSEQLKRAALGNFNYHTMRYHETRRQIKSHPGLFRKILEHFSRKREVRTEAQK